MKTTPIYALLLLLVLASSAQAIRKPSADTNASRPPRTPHAKRTGKPGDHLNVHERAEIAVSRLTFGARPSEVDRIAAKGEAGLQQWVAEQIAPPPEGGLEADLTKHEILTLSLEELLAKYSKESATDDPAFKPDEIRKAWSNAKIIRAVQSPHQFEERLVDMWFNHFNVDQRKGKDRWSFAAFERDAIRPFVYGKFGDMLRATARHPAMLFYLDNHLNRADTKKKAGINENYARELMELHTLGVDGGYTQADVGEVARILTGWAIKDDSQFDFKDKLHDGGEKKVMQWTFAAGGGEAEGEKLLQLLALHPATAKRVSRMIAETFVANPAPPALVAKLTAIYEKTGGDLKAIYKTMVESREFWDPAWEGNRVKDHFTWAVSTIRALDGEVLWKNDLLNAINDFGEPLYQCSPPTGYTHRPEDLINSGVLLSRLNLALKLAANRIDGVYAMVPKPHGLKTEIQVVRFLQDQMGLSRLSQSTIDALVSELKQDNWQTAYGDVRPFVIARLTGLILASPEFQRL